MRWPSVSIVLPVYNRTQYLQEAIASVLDQDYEGEMRVVVVDDGSDRPVRDAFVDRFPDVVWIRQRNRGLGAARQAGSLATSTDLIAYQDDDDLWRPGKLRRQVEFLHEHPEVGAVCGDMCYFTGTGRGTEGWFRRYARLHEALRQGKSLAGDAWVLERGALLDLVLLNIPPFAQSLVIRREFLLTIGGWNEAVRLYSECFDFFVRATLEGALGYIDAPLVDIRRGHVHMTGERERARILESRNLLRWGSTLRGSQANIILPRLVRRLVGVARRRLRARRHRHAFMLLAWAARLAARTPGTAARSAWTWLRARTAGGYR